MDARDFFDKLLQMFHKTTHAETRYLDYEFNGYMYEVGAVDSDGNREPVAWFKNEADADFYTGVHGCFPDLHRFQHTALDEAERADRQRDERECRIAELELEVQSLRKEVLTA